MRTQKKVTITLVIAAVFITLAHPVYVSHGVLGNPGFLAMESGTHQILVLVRATSWLSMMVSLRPEGLIPLPRVLFGNSFPLQSPERFYWGWNNRLNLTIRPQQGENFALFCSHTPFGVRYST